MILSLTLLDKSTETVNILRYHSVITPAIPQTYSESRPTVRLKDHLDWGFIIFVMSRLERLEENHKDDSENFNLVGKMGTWTTNEMCRWQPQQSYIVH